MEKEDRVFRVLKIYDTLRKGQLVKKHEMAVELGVNGRTVQRDIDALRSYLTYSSSGQDIEYDRLRKGYVLVGGPTTGISSKELLIIAKILLESRALNENEMKQTIKSLLNQSNKEEVTLIRTIVSNEVLHYEPVQHNKELMDMIWSLGEAIQGKKMVEITYERMDHSESIRTLKPVSIMFSEYYFYLIAFIHQREFTSPSIFRIDRIKCLNVLPKTFRFPEQDRIEEGVIRKRIQFMYSGELHRLKFKFHGPSVAIVLDRFPNAEVIETTKDSWILEAEVYGKGCLMWLLSQGDKVEILEPDCLREEMKAMIDKMTKIYNGEEGG